MYLTDIGPTAHGIPQMQVPHDVAFARNYCVLMGGFELIYIEQYAAPFRLSSEQRLHLLNS